MEELKVKAIQTQQFWEDKQANFDYLEKTFFATFKGDDVDLILLPEMFNTSFTMNATNMGESMNGNSVAWLLKWANKLNTHIGGSLIIEEDGDYFNRFVIVGPEGVKASYNKRHLFRMANEHEHFSAGNERVVFELKGWNILLQVCYDLRFPVYSRNTYANGKKEYDAVVYIANWPAKRGFIWKNLVQARAIENQAYAIGLNRVGKDGNDIEYTGDSMLVDPWGNIIEQAMAGTELVLDLTLKPLVLTDIAELFPAYLDADQFNRVD